MELIKNAIKCNQCKKILEDPIILPCGESVCKKHICFEAKTFCCYECGDFHPISSLIPNKAFAKILKTEIDQLDFGQEYTDAVNSCNILKDALRDIHLLKNDPYFYIRNIIDDMKTDIELKREELKMKVDEKVNSLINELEIYDSNFKNYLKSSEYEEKNQNYDEIIKSIEVKFNIWLHELNKLKVNIQEWKSIKLQADCATFNIRHRNLQMKSDFKADKLNELELKISDFKGAFINGIRNNQKYLETALIGTESRRLLKSNILGNQCFEDELLDLCEFPKDQKWKLAYRASEDGFSAVDFHRKCDNLPNTLTIIKSDKGYIFGGFTSSLWNKVPYGFVRDKNAFIFSLLNKDHMPIKIKVREGSEEYAIVGNERFGPMFGGDIDLVIYDNSNMNSASFSDLGSVYPNPFLNSKTSSKEKGFLAGSRNFRVIEIEVFQTLN